MNENKYQLVSMTGHPPAIVTSQLGGNSKSLSAHSRVFNGTRKLLLLQLSWLINAIILETHSAVVTQRVRQHHMDR